MKTHEWFILQTSDLQMRQMSRALATGSTSGWWRKRFDPQTEFKQQPLREHLGLPVFPIDLPSEVIDAMFILMHAPQTIAMAVKTLPPILSDKLTLDAWKALLIEYDFVSPEEEDTQEEEHVAADKGGGIFRTFKIEPSNPYQWRLFRIARALHEHVFANNPDAYEFIKGTRMDFACIFLVNYKRCVAQQRAHFKHPDMYSDDQVLADFLRELKMHDETGLSFFVNVLASQVIKSVKVSLSRKMKYDPSSKPINATASFGCWPLIGSVSCVDSENEVWMLSYFYK
jgi:hypothetical protein